MYGGGACGHMTDPLLVWMKVEHCILFVGCTSTFLEVDDDFTIPMTKMIIAMISAIFGEVSSNIQNIRILNILFIPCQSTNSPSLIQTRNR
jgi:hypothetical protein